MTRVSSWSGIRYVSSNKGRHGYLANPIPAILRRHNFVSGTPGPRPLSILNTISHFEAGTPSYSLLPVHSQVPRLLTEHQFRGSKNYATKMTSDSDNAAASPKRRGRPPKHKLDTQGTRVSPPALSSGQTNKRRKTTPEPSTITPPVSPPEMKKNGFTMMMEKKKKDGTDGSPSKSGSTKFHISPRKTEAVSPSADHASEANAPSNDIWPAPEENLEKAREFLRAW